MRAGVFIESAGSLVHRFTRPLAGRQAAIAEELANSLFRYSVHLETQFFLPLLALWRVAPEIAFANRQYTFASFAKVEWLCVENIDAI